VAFGSSCFRAAFALANHIPALAFRPPISWLFTGHRRFAVFGFIVAMVLTTPLSRLPRKRDRFMVAPLALVAVLCTSVWPFLAPAFNRGYLSRLQTQVDSDGVCRQSTDYTCGPAAAVTALRRLGLPAEEGQIALWAHTSSAIGTPPDVLAQELQAHSARDGLTAECRAFRNLADLRAAGLTLAPVKFSLMLDHFVTVLQVNDQTVIVGDPLNGRVVLSREEFLKKWEYVGVVLRRNP
jgi:hypothetical protein